MNQIQKIFFSFSLFIFSSTINANKIEVVEKSANELDTSLQIKSSVDQEDENLYSKYKEAVVKIYSNINIYNWFEPYKIPETAKVAGSGFFINKNGYILTNYHVVEGAKKVYINISSQGKKQFNCEVVAVYPERDIALIKLKEKDKEKVNEKIGEIPYLDLGNSDLIKDSQDLMVLGYPLVSDSIQFSEGIFSGKEKDMFGFEILHTTAPINHGNSGGPTVNSNGEVLGICVSKIEFAEGMGYIIPINEVINVLESLFDGQTIRMSPWGILSTEEITENTIKYLSNHKLDYGIYVQNIIPESLSDKYGIEKGDIIYRIDNMQIDIHGAIQIHKNEKMHVLTYLQKIKFGDSFNVSILRNGEEITIRIIKEPGNDFNVLKKLLPELGDKIDYEIIDGIVIMPLCGNHLNERNLFNVLGVSPNEFLFKDFRHMLIMTHILSDSDASEMTFSEQSRVLRKVNNIKVETLDELRKIVRQSLDDNDEYLILENHIGGIIAIPTEKVIESYEELPDLNINFQSPIFEEVASKA